MIARPQYLNKLIAKKENGLIKIITGNRRCGKSYLLFTIYHQYLIDDEEKRYQEINSLCRINDSFKKFVVIKDNIEPWQDDKGILYIGIEQFLLEEDWLR